MWHITTQKYGANALGLRRVVEPGCYETSWQWLHKLRRAMVRPGRDRLSGYVQVDETYVGGRKKGGKRGRGAEGKALVVIGVEDKAPKGIGRIRLLHVADASAKSLGGFMQAMIEPGSVVRTDDWSGYTKLPTLGYKREVLPLYETQASSSRCLSAQAVASWHIPRRSQAYAPCLLSGRVHIPL